MKVAAFNVENLFDRAKAFNEATAEATAVVNAVAQLNVLFEKEVYSEADKAGMLELMAFLGILRDDEGPYVWFRRPRGQLVRRPRGSSRPVQVVADGRADWIGWVEHKTVHVNEIAVMNTGRVIRDVDADILAVIEAENRTALMHFTDYVLGKVKDEVDVPPDAYRHVMLIDGNDGRGIDVGLMTKRGYPIGLMRSHVDDFDGDNRIFSRDCPEYQIKTPGGATLWVLPNHFKSKFGGNDGPSKRKREAQARRVRELYDALIADGHPNVVVLGDLNDTPESEPMLPLLSGGPRDVSEHPAFDTGEFPGRGTFGLGNDSDKIDYLLLSPALFARVTSCGLFRKGAWPGVRPRPRWTVYPQLEDEVHVASDHHVIWAEIDID